MENHDHNDVAENATARNGFFIHLFIFIVAMTILILINVITSDDYYWFKWPLIGWGAVLIILAFRVFNPEMGYRP